MSHSKNIVVDFYNKVFVEHHAKEGAEAHLAPDYIQHNPSIATGRQPFIDFFVPYFAQNPNHRARIVRVIADDHLVAVHVHVTNGPTDRGVAIVDIFRVEHGKIVEHWDVIQPVAENPANSNTMF